jgi:hypothetical protein
MLIAQSDLALVSSFFAVMKKSCLRVLSPFLGDRENANRCRLEENKVDSMVVGGKLAVAEFEEGSRGALEDERDLPDKKTDLEAFISNDSGSEKAHWSLDEARAIHEGCRLALWLPWVCYRHTGSTSRRRKHMRCGGDNDLDIEVVKARSRARAATSPASSRIPAGKGVYVVST